MPNILFPEIEAYMAARVPPRDEVLQEMESLAADRDIPIVGPQVGTFLYQITHLKGARRIFELGSAIGYSTVWLARAAGPGAEVFYTDSDEVKADQAREFFVRAGVDDRIQLKVGDALEMFDATGGDFDLIFNDVDKQDYTRVLARVLPRLRKGGLFITDNVLWSGRVTGPAAPDDAATRAIQEFNELASVAEGCVYTIIPIRDGVGVLLKT